MGASQGNRKLIYLFSDSTSAARWAFTMEWDFERPTSIIVVENPPGLIVHDDHPQMQLGYDGAVTTDESIPPECIKRVVTLTTEMKRELARTGKLDF